MGRTTAPLLPFMTLRLPLAFVRPVFAAFCILLSSQRPLAAQSPAPQAALSGFHAEILKDFNANSLINSSGLSVPLRRISDKKNLFFYFSGKFCPPCKIFTPKLIDFYQKYAKTGDFEIVFISEDSDANTMKTYMAESRMPWLAIRFGDPVVNKIKDRLQQKGYPILFLLDENDVVIAKPEPGDGDHVSWNPVKVWQKNHNLPITHWPFDFNAMQAH